MDFHFIVPVAIVFIVIGLPIIGAFMLAFAKIMKGSSRSDSVTEGEESRMVQDMHRGLSKLESRIDALESIILDRDSRTRDDRRSSAKNR